jgi:Domain of unknown function (DUF4265)
MTERGGATEPDVRGRPANPWGFVKIRLTSPDGQVETLWAEPVRPSVYRLDNEPFFSYGISCDDLIEAVPDESGYLEFVRVVESSGNRTVRILFDKFSATSAQGQELIEQLRAEGCSYEGAFSKLLAITVPPDVSLEAITSLLEKSGLRWEYANPTSDQLHAPQA